MDNVNVSEIMSKVMSNPALMNSLKATAETLFGAEPQNADEVVVQEKSDKKEDNEANKPEIQEKNNDSDEKHIENEQRMQLLLALKPYMDDNRREKIDYMLKIMKLFQITEIGGLIKNLL